MNCDRPDPNAIMSGPSHLWAAPVTSADSFHGEGPVWHPSFNGIRWVDMLAGDILELTGDGVRRTHVAAVAAAFRPRRNGGIVLAEERRFVILDRDYRVEDRTEELWSDPDVRFNDGGCDPSGRFWCGSMSYTERPGAGAMYLLKDDFSVQPLFDGLTVSNGFDIAGDPTFAYHVDTPTAGIDVFALADPTASRRRFVEIPSDAGYPDGLVVDAAGGVWIALWNGAAVHRYTPDGLLDLIVHLPVTQVTACTFGGPHLDTLFITTSKLTLTHDELATQPLAGALFAIKPGYRGLPAREFGS